MILNILFSLTSNTYTVSCIIVVSSEGQTKTKEKILYYSFQFYWIIIKPHNVLRTPIFFSLQHTRILQVGK
jgi:hypothetical protein